MDSEEVFEVAVSVRSITNARHTCAGSGSTGMPAANMNYCPYCGVLLDKRAEITTNISLPSVGGLKPFLVELDRRIKCLAEKEIAAYLDAAAHLDTEDT